MPAFELRRPTDVADMRARFDAFYTPEARLHWQNFRPAPSDVIVSTFPKSGTTWVQQIMHCLRTGGDMSFEEISYAVPWLEVAHDVGIDLNAPQSATPRMFKSHLAADEIPFGARYVIVVRHAADVLKSYYNFMAGWFFVPGSISIEDFAESVLFDARGSEDYWHHFLSWWHRRNDPDVLLLSYEDMLADTDRAISAIARHCGIDLDPGLWKVTRRNASHEFMKRHADQFDERSSQAALDLRCGLPEGGEGSKVGRLPQSLKKVPDAIRERIERMWHERVKGRTGLASYDDFRKSVALLLRQASGG